jgi:tRNA(fMet)-specific endonuclease VapC
MIRALDTNVIVELLRGNDQALAGRYLAASPRHYAVPEMVRAELLFGAAVSARPDANRAAVERLLQPLRLLPFAGEAAGHYAAIRAELQQRGTPIGANDLIIAATARAHGCTLVTRNTAGFDRVPALALERW